MTREEAIGRIETRLREISAIHIKGKRKDDPTRKYYEGMVEGMKETKGYLMLLGEA